MRSIQKFARSMRSLGARAFSLLPAEGVSRPVFILGCGRSGTTIFGMALSKHRSITYLNEPRRLWFAAYPQTDIWTDRARQRQGKLLLTAADADPKKSTKLRRLFRFEALVQRRPVLVEKLPINSFRLDFIRAIFPDARFLHIHRNGLEVARSIERLSQNGQWFGANSFKWDQLVQHALNSRETQMLPGLCTSFFHMGLLEWRLSTEAIAGFLRTLPEHRYCELSYEQFVKNPVAAMEQVMAFLELSRDEQVIKFVGTRVERKTASLQFAPLSNQDAEIGGPLLPQSMAGGAGLAWRAA